MRKAGEIFGAFWEPVLADERRAAKAVWNTLSDELKESDQVLGRHSAGCAATYGVYEACISCTACYLSNSKRDAPYPWPVQGQLKIRRILVPKNTDTAGVTAAL